MKCLLVFCLTLFFITFSRAMINSEISETQPYYAYVTFASLQTSFYGGGALISFQHVLTCAANIRGFNMWRIGVGSNSRRMQRTFTTTRAVVHPDYNEDLQNHIRTNDIGIIILLSPIERSNNVAPILISPFAFHNITNTQGMVLGHAGSTTTGNEGLDELQAAHVRIISDIDCLQAYPNGANQSIFCASDRQRRSNFCLGDQGGPFSVVSRGTEYLVGIASLPGCSNIVSSYMPVISYRDWIREEINV
ncbi:hypothetical protein PVAND_003421 [Polypedilum vanderplanki]|uniref:Peptidase S1 domain-containing protein n=1 Tax=Polypedilum vanderplanki TaxID=319348 RepID=A0A9J6BU00_POLVA|nr:hypothetical protein PVAND_003421 [Polypedilum vanderplanki]